MTDVRPLIERQAEAWLHRARTMDRTAERVERDPCGYCGVRGDIPCRHRRAA